MRRWLGVGGLLALAACASGGAPGSGERPRGVQPGITVLVRDSLHLVKGKRVALLADARLGDASGTPDLSLLRAPTVAEAGVSVVELPAQRAPTASDLRDVDLLLIDVQGDGTRLGSETMLLVAALRAAASARKPVLVLDRPTPLNGERTEGGVPDAHLAAMARDDEGGTEVPGLYPVPTRHGMTTGELARVLDDRLGIGADPRVLAMRGWSRSMWFDQTRLPWVAPSPEVPTWTAAFVRAVVAPLEGSNLVVRREEEGAVFRVGAPWLDVRHALARIEDREPNGLRVRASSVSVDGRDMPALRVEVLDRASQASRVAAYVLWAVVGAGGRDSLRLAPGRAEVALGSAEVVRELLAGGDPDEAGDQLLALGVTFRNAARSSFLYYR